MILPRRLVYLSLSVAMLALGIGGILTVQGLKPLPISLELLVSPVFKAQYADRYGAALNRTYQNHWNQTHQLALHEMPELMRVAVISAEDRRFYDHHGVDWLARLAALAQNVAAMARVRGASTITEQVVRMIHPRRRTLWSRWLEGFEAYGLEQRFSKQEILAFYLNQVPYGAQRRGIKQAAHYYFDRDLSTLNEAEQLALLVLVRSPKWYDPIRQAPKLNAAVTRLADKLRLQGDVLKDGTGAIQAVPLSGRGAVKTQDFSHVIRHMNQTGLWQRAAEVGSLLDTTVDTTLDTSLQTYSQSILDSHMTRLQGSRVRNGAVLVVEHESNEIRAWAVAYAGSEKHAFNQIDSVLAKRQPGSTLKPLLYALSLEKGWTAATRLLDEPLSERVGLGLHSYRNYSGRYYGKVTVRQALGNSLNVPAVKALQFVGVGNFLVYLHKLGITSLNKHPNVYGDGLALGNGEVSLLEMVQAYTVLARKGFYKPMSLIKGRRQRQTPVIDPNVAAIIADIMSDKHARSLEFGPDSVLNLPYQTAVKTGTSSDYRDAWAIGFNDAYTVGVWMGNLDYQAMNNITGSKGPALVLRSVFSRLNSHRQVRPLPGSEKLLVQRICIDSGKLAADDCDAMDELFVPGTEFYEPLGGQVLSASGPIRLRKPTQGLILAMDPRIPDESEYFEFQLKGQAITADWFVDGKFLATTDNGRLSWPLRRGDHRVWVRGVDEELSVPVNFQVR